MSERAVPPNRHVGRREVTLVLHEINEGRPDAASRLLPLVYEELRRLAASRMAKLPPGQTLQATALVHDAYLRLVGIEDPGWEGRGHFFGAAARAMRNILVYPLVDRWSFDRSDIRAALGP